MHLPGPRLEPLAVHRHGPPDRPVQTPHLAVDRHVGSVERHDVGAESRRPENALRYAAWLGVGPPRDPDSLGGELGTSLVQDRRWVSVRHDVTAVVEHDQPVGEVDPRSQPVLHDDRCQPPGMHDLADTGPDRCGVLGIEHRRRLVEQQHGGLESQGARERQALLLTAGQRVGRRVLRHGEADRGQGGGDARGHGRARHTDVLQAEGHVTTDGRRHHARPGLLQDEAHGAGAGSRLCAVDERRATALAGVGDLEDPGKPAQNRGLARAARADEQDALAGWDVEVEAGDDRVATAVRPPGQSPDLDVARSPRALRQRWTPWPPGPAGRR